MKNIIPILLLSLVGLFVQCATSPVDDIEQIKANYRSVLLNESKNDQSLIKILEGYAAEVEVSDQVVVDVQLRYTVTEAQVETLLALQSEDGSWEDIDYTDTKGSGWDPKRHSERLLILTKAYVDPRHPLYEDENVQKGIQHAIKFWNDFEPVSVPSWYNLIGVPKTMGEAYILYEPYMSEQEMGYALSEMSKPYIHGTGQNLVWLTGNVLMRALLQKDAASVKECRDIIMGEIVNEREEGIKPDWSFHQHGAQQQFGNYGMSFIMSMGLYTTLFDKTTLAFEPDKIELLTQFVKSGYRWTLWNGMLDINTLTRQFYHNAPRDKGIGLGFATSQLLAASGDQELQEMLNENFAGSAPTQFIGNNYFWSSDYGVHRTEEWMVSVRCSSSRIIGTEEVNHDNLIGSYVGDGVTLIYQRGDEYQNIMPVWDWHKLPGVTAWSGGKKNLHPNKKENNRASFVGGVSSGESGLWVMNVDRGDGLMAQKSWIMTSEVVLCMGSAISTTDHGALTTIDQRFKRGEITHFHNGEWSSVDGVKTVEGDARFYHDNLGYIVLGAEASTTFGWASQSGEWNKVMGFYKPNFQTADVVTLQINHGQKPHDATYSYLLLPSKSQAEVAAFDVSSIKILKCDKAGKVVLMPSGELFVEAQQPFAIELPEGKVFEAITPAVYILSAQRDTVTASEPAQSLPNIEGAYNEVKFTIEIDQNSGAESKKINI